MGTSFIARLLVVSWTAEHALSLSSAAAPSVGEERRYWRPPGSRRDFATAPRRLNYSCPQQEDDHEECSVPAMHGTTIAESSTTGRSSTTATRYTIDVDVHPDVAYVAVKHATQLPRFLEHYPISSHTQDAYAKAFDFVREFHLSHGLKGNRHDEDLHEEGDEKSGVGVSRAQRRPQERPLPVMMDSGCGTGRSSALLAKSCPHLPVIGIDRSAVRLSKGGKGDGTRSTGRRRRVDGWTKQVDAEQCSVISIQDSHNTVDGGNPRLARRKGDIDGCRREPPPPNLLLLRADLVDLWILASRNKAWDVQEHFILYPNPYPKRSQLRSRWHGHSVFPVLLGLGGRITLRSNWKIYLEEVCQAILAINYEAKKSKRQGNLADGNRRDGRGSDGEPVLNEREDADDTLEMEIPALVADAAASYAASARAGPSLFNPAVPAATNFEAKYVAVGEPVYQLRLEPRRPEWATQT